MRWTAVIAGLVIGGCTSAFVEVPEGDSGVDSEAVGVSVGGASGSGGDGSAADSASDVEQPKLDGGADTDVPERDADLPDSTSGDVGIGGAAGTAGAPSGGSGGEAGTAGATSTVDAGRDADDVPDVDVSDSETPDVGTPDAGPGDPSTCPGMTFSLGESAPYYWSLGQVARGPDSGDGTCGGSLSSDSIFRFTAPADGRITIEYSTTGFDGVLYVRTTCNTPATEVECANDAGTNATETMQFEAKSGFEYWVFADGVGSIPGTGFLLSVSLSL